MKFNRRKISKAVTLIIWLPVLWLVFLGLRNSIYTSTNDSDLIFTRPKIPVESNAFWTLIKATNVLYWPKNLDRRLTDLTNNTNWDNSLAAYVLITNRASLDLFDKAMQQPYLLVPEPKNFDDDFPYLASWKEFGSVESIQINSLHRAGKDAEAFDHAFEIIKFGQRAENSGGTMIHYLVGSAIKNIGFRRIQQMTTDTALSENDLVQAIYKLNNFGPNKEGLTNVLKVEYKTHCDLINDFANGHPPEITNRPEQMIASVVIKPLLCKGETKAEFAREDRFLFETFSKPFAGIVWCDLPTNPSPFMLIISGNAIGDILLNMLDPTLLQGFMAGKSRENVKLTATQILLALKVYKVRNGKLPDSLSKLVPEFFPQVPLDDFDGKPFRYLPDKKIIYSVGPCLKDLSGQERKKESNDYNLPYKINF